MKRANGRSGGRLKPSAEALTTSRLGASSAIAADRAALPEERGGPATAAKTFKAYDVSTKAYVDAFRPARPQLFEKDVYWRVTLMVGAYRYAFSDTHRLEELAKGICNPEDPNEILAQVSGFIVGALSAPPSAGSAATLPPSPPGQAPAQRRSRKRQDQI